MGSTGECAGIRPQLGVYVTGAIAPADRAVVVRHLASCGRCRDELAGLAALPGLLRRLPARPAAPLPGEGAGAPGREAGEALLGRVLRRIAARRSRRRRALAAAAAVLAVAAATGWALRPGPPPPGPAAAAATILQTDRIGGVTVLTDAAGFTLYWFAPDTTATSKCTGSCARRWPPVTGPATAGAGVTGAVSWIRRPDGSIQATYDGHPLYTASVDTGPGQARGNGVTASGGLWHEVAVPGAGAAATSPPPGTRSAGSGAGGYGY
jgi:predicted lipoprotein with Yx(FWY)xxD motif